MPEIFRNSGYKVFFYSDEGEEPIHVHVRKAGHECKIWIDSMTIARSTFPAHELSKIIKLVAEHETIIRNVWNERSGN